jgi:hypothetical protein
MLFNAARVHHHRSFRAATCQARPRSFFRKGTRADLRSHIPAISIATSRVTAESLIAGVDKLPDRSSLH